MSQVAVLTLLSIPQAIPSLSVLLLLPLQLVVPRSLSITLKHHSYHLHQLELVRLLMVLEERMSFSVRMILLWLVTMHMLRHLVMVASKSSTSPTRLTQLVLAQSPTVLTERIDLTLQLQLRLKEIMLTSQVFLMASKSSTSLIQPIRVELVLLLTVQVVQIDLAVLLV